LEAFQELVIIVLEKNSAGLPQLTKFSLITLKTATVNASLQWQISLLRTKPLRGRAVTMEML
jgi:hypothetical protein